MQAVHNGIKQGSDGYQIVNIFQCGLGVVLIVKQIQLTMFPFIGAMRT